MSWGLTVGQPLTYDLGAIGERAHDLLGLSLLVRSTTSWRPEINGKRSFVFARTPSTSDLSHVSVDPKCRDDPLQPPVVRPIVHSVVLILVPSNKNAYDLAMLDWNQCPTVERLPGKVGGVWLFKGTRVPVRKRLPPLGLPPGDWKP
jgi:hypothetical protein